MIWSTCCGSELLTAVLRLFRSQRCIGRMSFCGHVSISVSPYTLFAHLPLLELHGLRRIRIYWIWIWKEIIGRSICVDEFWIWGSRKAHRCGFEYDGICNRTIIFERVRRVEMIQRYKYHLRIKPIPPHNLNAFPLPDVSALCYHWIFLRRFSRRAVVQATWMRKPGGLYFSSWRLWRGWDAVYLYLRRFL